ncbi:MAG: sigma-54 dependent transcriptional regulator [Alphaproteobacteria bacterium]|nr:sigma-54 dependent transcriptional regulator [Alphaproteobacteria bacterium]
MTMEFPEQGYKVLLVDDDRSMRDSLNHLLTKAGFQVDAHFRASDAISALSKTQPDVVLTDMKMPGLSGFDLLEAAQDQDRDLPVILISAHGDVPLAVDAMERGAHNFLEKPYHPGRLITILTRAAESHRLTRDNRNLRARLTDLSGLDRVLLGTSRAMVDLRAEIMDLATRPMPVLLLGETGTGKEVVARALHDLGPRCGGSFVPVNCASLSESEFGSLMFGARDGDDVGYIQRAEGGTLFLDEIDALSVEQQGFLLRVLEEGEISPVGSSTTQAVDVRIVSASSSDLQKAIENEQLRPDLYYRLNATSLSLPPLQARPDDIVLLFAHFVDLHCETYEIRRPEVTAEDTAALLAHSWPGNVRELRHVAERRVLAARRGLGSVAEAIARDGDADDMPNTLREAVAAFERQLIGNALIAHDGKMDAVAEALGIGRRTLNEKMVKLNLDRSKFM